MSTTTKQSALACALIIGAAVMLAAAPARAASMHAEADSADMSGMDAPSGHHAGRHRHRGYAAYERPRIFAVTPRGVYYRYSPGIRPRVRASVSASAPISDRAPQPPELNPASVRCLCDQSQRMEADMNKTIAGGALALALLGGAALLPAPASANSIHDNGDFGGTWSRIGPSETYGPAPRRFLRAVRAAGLGLWLLRPALRLLRPELPRPRCCARSRLFRPRHRHRPLTALSSSLPPGEGFVVSRRCPPARRKRRRVRGSRPLTRPAPSAADLVIPRRCRRPCHSRAGGNPVTSGGRDRGIEVVRIRILLLKEPDLPSALPFLQLLLTLDRIADLAERLEMDEPRHVVFRRVVFAVKPFASFSRCS